MYLFQRKPHKSNKKYRSHNKSGDLIETILMSRRKEDSAFTAGVKSYLESKHINLANQENSHLIQDYSAFGLTQRFSKREPLRARGLTDELYETKRNDNEEKNERRNRNKSNEVQDEKKSRNKIKLKPLKDGNKRSRHYAETPSEANEPLQPRFVF